MTKNNILITGAAGYVGGSVLAEFLSKLEGPIHDATIYAVVRGDNQVKALSELGIQVMHIDLSNESEVETAVVDNEINMVINTAAAFDPTLVARFMKALGEQKRRSGAEAYFVQTSVLNSFTTEFGWPAGAVSDSEPLHDLQKENKLPNPVFATNLVIDDLGEAEGVTTFNIALPLVYGRGTGAWRKLSVNFPAYIRAAMKDRVVHKFEVDASPAAMHISDLTALYALVVEKALLGKPMPSGKQGYYFAMAHHLPNSEALDRLAKHMHARGLVDRPEVQIWPSHELAAEKLEFPLQILNGTTMTSGEFAPVNASKLGWKPQWDLERFLHSLDDEVQAVLDLDTVKPTLFLPLMK